MAPLEGPSTLDEGALALTSGDVAGNAKCGGELLPRHRASAVRRAGGGRGGRNRMSGGPRGGAREGPTGRTRIDDPSIDLLIERSTCGFETPRSTLGRKGLVDLSPKRKVSVERAAVRGDAMNAPPPRVRSPRIPGSGTVAGLARPICLHLTARASAGRGTNDAQWESGDPAIGATRGQRSR